MTPAVRPDSTPHGWGRTLALWGLLAATPGHARIGDPAFVPTPRTTYPTLIAATTPQPPVDVELVVRGGHAGQRP